MDQVVAAGHFSVRIGKNRKRVALVLRQVARRFRIVDADRYRVNSCLSEVFQILLNAP